MNQSLSSGGKINKTQKESDRLIAVDLPSQSAAPGIGYQPEKFNLGHQDMVTRYYYFSQNPSFRS
jgi:hypothetical protein